jgi:hypothetical protein
VNIINCTKCVTPKLRRKNRNGDSVRHSKSFLMCVFRLDYPYRFCYINRKTRGDKIWLRGYAPIAGTKKKVAANPKNVPNVINP